MKSLERSDRPASALLSVRRRRRGEKRKVTSAAVDISTWIDRQKVSALQVAVACLCGAAVMLDGFDSQIIGFVAPALIQEFKVPPATLAPVFSAGLFGILAGCLLLAPLA